MAPGETLAYTFLPRGLSPAVVEGNAGEPWEGHNGSTLDHTLMKVIILRRWEGNSPAESGVGLELIEI